MMTACTSEELPVPQPESAESAAPFKPGEIIVKFRPEVSDQLDRLPMATRGGTATRSGMVPVDEVLESIGAFELERVFPVDTRTEGTTRDKELHLWYVVRFDASHSVEEVAARLSAVSEVQQISVNRTLQRAYTGTAHPLSASAYAALLQRQTRAGGTDPLLPLQWDLANDGTLFDGRYADPGLPEPTTPKSVAGADVQCLKAWEKCMGDPAIVVAVLDEGVCLEHEDLQHSLWVNEDEIDRSQQDNDGNGYAGDRYGYNFANGTGIITWDNINDTGHGTHVAGLIAACNGNGTGIGSIAGGTEQAPGVRIMSCQIFSGSISADVLTSVRAMKYAADNGAVILQCSWGYPSGASNPYENVPMYSTEEEWETYSPLEKLALEYFVHHAGSPNGPIDGGLVIFASGNESAPMAAFPGAANMCIAVSATAADFTPAVYTNYGTGVDIVAPGGDQNYYYDYGPEAVARAVGVSVLQDDEHTIGELGCILSTLPKTVSPSGYGYMEGTSMACPHVSGVAALGLSYAAKLRKHFTAGEYRNLLISTARPFVGDLETGWPGSKTYYTYVMELGTKIRQNLMLSAYRGRMGGGQADAARLLEAVGDEANGCPVAFPNLYIAPEKTVELTPAAYFADGESLTYTVDIVDTSVASCTAVGPKLRFTGLKEGTTMVSIRTSNGTTQAFCITVRRNASGNGWL